MVKTELNGVLKVTRRSVRKFQFEDEGPVVELDVIAVSDAWHSLSASHRILDGDKLVIKMDKFEEYAQARLNFVQAVVNDAYPPEVKAPTLDRASAEEFLKLCTEATDELRNFIFGNDDETSSPPTSTEGEARINFSQ